MNFSEMKVKLKDSISAKRYKHSIGTMNEAEKLAIHYGVNVEKAKIAGLLHDCGKSIKKNDNLTHAALSAELAKSVYHIEDKDIINAICYHTTGRKNMTLLEKIIFIADKTEINRDYDGVENIRDISYKNIDDALINSLESTIEYVKKRNEELDMESIKTLKFLKEEK